MYKPEEITKLDQRTTACALKTISLCDSLSMNQISVLLQMSECDLLCVNHNVLVASILHMMCKTMCTYIVVVLVSLSTKSTVYNSILTSELEAVCTAAGLQ